MFGQIERWIPLARLPVFRPHCLNSNCWIWEEQSGTKFNFSDSILQWNLYGKDLHLHWELVKRLFSNYWITSYCPFIIIIYDYYYRFIRFWLHRNGFFLWFAFQVDSSSLEIFGFCNINFFSLSLLFHSPPPPPLSPYCNLYSFLLSFSFVRFLFTQICIKAFIY